MSKYTYEREDDGIFTIHRPDGSPLATVDTQEDAEFIVAELTTQAATIEKCREALGLAVFEMDNDPYGCAMCGAKVPVEDTAQAEAGRKHWFIKHEKGCWIMRGVVVLMETDAASSANGGKP